MSLLSLDDRENPTHQQATDMVANSSSGLAETLCSDQRAFLRGDSASLGALGRAG